MTEEENNSQYYVKQIQKPNTNSIPMTMTECNTYIKTNENIIVNLEEKEKTLNKFEEFKCLKNDNLQNEEKFLCDKKYNKEKENFNLFNIKSNFLDNNIFLNIKKDLFNPSEKCLNITNNDCFKVNRELRDFSKFAIKKNTNLNNSNNNQSNNNIFSQSSNFTFSSIFTNNNKTKINNNNNLNNKNNNCSNNNLTHNFVFSSNNNNSNEKNIIDMLSKTVLNSGKKILNQRNFDNIKLNKQFNLKNNKDNLISKLSNKQNSITPINNQTVLIYDSSKIKKNFENKKLFSSLNNNFSINNNNSYNNNKYLDVKDLIINLKMYFGENFPFCKKRKRFIDYTL
jgi:hypothetical protein